ncbi:uncharacterized protein BP5553_10387 [Venustampulla echinocandica]|uniref:Uncharacterized protein n=1 Tax=Venustampulla echinocandica TaxID=2656787 RepID=A0A370T971_9HELO|nr:uncharacterized protein BP5553_10387 [Venustampulla echinocandica]RDL30109.1 hypothetical protein BP5553_10387 [Venustampulla echinocandica]
MRRLGAKFVSAERTPQSESPSAKALATKIPLSLPAPAQSISGLRELNIGTPSESEDIAMKDVSDGSLGLDPRRTRATLGNGISAGSASPSRGGSASPPPRRPKARPTSTPGSFGPETESRQPGMFDIPRPPAKNKQLWSPDQDLPLARTSLDRPNIASVQAQRSRAQALRPKSRKSFNLSPQTTGSRQPLTRHAQTTGTPSTSFSKANPAQASQAIPRDESFNIMLQPETRQISQEQLVAEVKAIYAGLVAVEAKCIEVDNKQATLAEQWPALIALHRTLLHEHNDFFLASQHPSASPALRRLASKYAMPARTWRHGMLSFLELLKDRLPASLDDTRDKLTFMELAYTMMDLLREANPAFEDTWITCLADFNRHLSSIRNNFKDTSAWASLVREWHSDVSNKFSVALSYVPKVYAKSAFFFRKAIRISVNGKECLARPDSGSEKDVCSEAFANQHGLHISQNDEDKILFKLGTKTEVQSIGRTLVSCGLASDTNPPEERWFCVLKKCVAPIIMGERFIKKIKLYGRNKHLLVRCPNWFGRLPTLKYIGSPNNQIRFKAGGHALIACADTGSDEDFMSLDCAKRNGFKIDRRQSTRIVIQQADGSIVETVGQVRVSVKIGPMDEFKMNFHVLPNLTCEVIFCEEFLEQTDGFKTLVESPHVSKDDDEEFQEAPHALNTLINLGPINAYANRIRSTVAENTPQQEHDNAIVAEIYQRNKVNKSIASISDENERQEAREIESVRKNDFDQSHAECAICIQRSNQKIAR